MSAWNHLVNKVRNASTHLAHTNVTATVAMNLIHIHKSARVSIIQYILYLAIYHANL